MSLGIDAEPAERLPSEVVSAVLSPSERAALADLPVDGAYPWDRIIFSVKESLFKAWFPLRGTWLGFEDAEIGLDANGTFTARLLPPDIGNLPRQLPGGWAVHDGIIATGLAIPPAPPEVKPRVVV